MNMLFLGMAASTDCELWADGAGVVAADEGPHGEHTVSFFLATQVWDAADQAFIRYEASDVGQQHIGHVVENARLQVGSP